MNVSGRSGLRGLTYALGGVATAAGLDTAIRGARSLPGEHAVADPAIESELRFYSGFYVAYGLTALRIARRADRDVLGLRALAGALFLSGLARGAAWRAAGTPNRGQRALLAVELVLPPALVAWQAGLADQPTG